jgi:hypothetical protein
MVKDKPEFLLKTRVEYFITVNHIYLNKSNIIINILLIISQDRKWEVIIKILYQKYNNNQKRIYLMTHKEGNMKNEWRIFLDLFFLFLDIQ